mmetsp:Transcript_18957/g.48210  ORF Transcript_18957/g.48210 Transcript_18957/m.48210 type:complete len:216 (+) Transcript_18957:147-794(+)
MFMILVDVSTQTFVALRHVSHFSFVFLLHQADLLLGIAAHAFVLFNLALCASDLSLGATLLLARSLQRLARLHDLVLAPALHALNLLSGQIHLAEVVLLVGIKLAQLFLYVVNLLLGGLDVGAELLALVALLHAVSDQGGVLGHLLLHTAQVLEASQTLVQLLIRESDLLLLAFHLCCQLCQIFTHLLGRRDYLRFEHVDLLLQGNNVVHFYIDF